ncbi:MAG: hypothetical protein ACKOUM_11500, partial [Sphingopyxis sp.]
MIQPNIDPHFAPHIEPIIEAALPIIDPHHHLWDLAMILPVLAQSRHVFMDVARAKPLYTLDDLAA